MISGASDQRTNRLEGDWHLEDMKLSCGCYSNQKRGVPLSITIAVSVEACSKAEAGGGWYPLNGGSVACQMRAGGGAPTPCTGADVRTDSR